MEKRMLPIEISSQDGKVFLFQIDPQGNDDVAIMLIPEQIPLVCKWLKEAASSAKMGE